MDSKSNTQLPFEDFTYGNDPDQWWQPDDPEWELPSVTQGLASLGQGIGKATRQIIDEFAKLFPQGIYVNTGDESHRPSYHNPPSGSPGNYSVKDEEDKNHTHISFGRGSGVILSSKQAEAVVSVMSGEPLKDFLERTNRALAPLIEGTQGHWAVCKHRPRCKKPGPGAAFNEPAQNKKRPRRHR